ncbi:MAG: D-sedoheptulose 7-phosphate isomerase [Bacteroidales bacterium]|jgi:D-sedoheptulose 7-phosphate isomerase|nr:D-sedoheptulose 7-phosphate isomerase [Bacteroidales bacterium]
MIKQAIQDSIDVKTQLLNDENLLQGIQTVVDAIVKTYQLSPYGKVLFCGNGGSAADAQHLAAELSGRFYYDRPPLHADALHCDTSYLTAVANDYSYYEVYARLIRAKGRENDVLIGLSTSGNSANVINAMKTAKERGMFVVAMTGETGGEMKNHCDVLLNMPSKDTPRIQEGHALVGHIICQLVERELFPK